MKRAAVVLLAILVAACLLAGLGWLFFMHSVNTNVTQVSVSVAGSVDQVSLFRDADPSHPVATIRTHGQDTTQVIALPSAENVSGLFQARPAQYYFVSQVGEQRYRSGPVCCRVGFLPEHRTLTIRSLSEWEVSSE